jgi:hypothetical protein
LISRYLHSRDSCWNAAQGRFTPVKPVRDELIVRPAGGDWQYVRQWHKADIPMKPQMSAFYPEQALAASRLNEARKPKIDHFLRG